MSESEGTGGFPDLSDKSAAAATEGRMGGGFEAQSEQLLSFWFGSQPDTPETVRALTAVWFGGDREFDDFPTLDLHLDRPFAIGGGELIAGIDVFNLFNSDAVTDVRRLVNDQDPADPTTLFGSTRLRQAPRTIRLNLGFRW
jgi:hypothetical protein